MSGLVESFCARVYTSNIVALVVAELVESGSGYTQGQKEERKGLISCKTFF